MLFVGKKLGSSLLYLINGFTKQVRVLKEVISTSRICVLSRMNSQSFTSSSVTTNPENFIEDLKRVFHVIYIPESKRVELESYQIGLARIRFNQLKKNRAEDLPVVS